MPLPSSGEISISDINAEFSLGNSLGPYRNTPRWINNNFSFFPSGAIDMSDFYNTSKTGVITLSSPVVGGITLTSLVTSLTGWDGTTPISISFVLANGFSIVPVWSSSPSTVYAIDTGVFPVGSQVSILVQANAYIAGASGPAGIFFSPPATGDGSEGTRALRIRTPLSLTNYGIIAGGGGSGGGGPGARGCYPNPSPPPNYSLVNGGSGGNGGAAIVLESPTEIYNYGIIGGGGGGGGGGGIDTVWDASPGAGGGGAGLGIGGNASTCGATNGRFGANGATGTLEIGGTGGGGGNQFVPDGGNGGDLGQSGSVGQTSGSSGGAGGNGGNSIRGYSNYTGGVVGDLRGATSSGV